MKIFYIELITVVKENINFRDEVYDILPCLDPQVAQSFKRKSLIEVCKRFPIIQQFVNMQHLDNEWKEHALMEHAQEGLDATMPADIYWVKVLTMKTSTGKPAFPNLHTALRLLLVLPFSNASVERIFSTLRNCKTVNRNRLKTDTLVALIATKEGVSAQKGSKNFEPIQKMLEASLWD